jgi:hypothetical protein
MYVIYVRGSLLFGSIHKRRHSHHLEKPFLAFLGSFFALGSTQSRYLSALGFWNIEFEKSSLMNWNFCLVWTRFFTACVPCKIWDWNRQKIEFIKLDFSNSIFQNPSADRYCEWLRLLHKYIQKWFFIILPMFVKSSSKIFYRSEIILQTDINFPM